MQQDKWNLIVSSYLSNPRDVITVPLGNRKGRWFYVNVEEDKVVISQAQQHGFSSSLKYRRVLNPNELDTLFDLYLKRLHGEQVSQEVLNASINAS